MITASLTVSLGGTIRRFEGPNAWAEADAFIQGAHRRPKPPTPAKGVAPTRAIDAAARANAERREAFHQAVLAHLPPHGHHGRTVSQIADVLDMSDKHTARILRDMLAAGLIASMRKGCGGKRWFTLRAEGGDSQP